MKTDGECTTAVRRFNEVWDVLSAAGACDAGRGAEWQRVVSAWIKAGEPVGITAYIIQHANMGGA